MKAPTLKDLRAKSTADVAGDALRNGGERRRLVPADDVYTIYTNGKQNDVADDYRIE